MGTSASLEVSSSAKKPLVSDLPVECSICGVTLRQSRNLRRHMELIHLKVEGGGKSRKSHQVKDEIKKIEEDSGQNIQVVQTLTEVDPLDVGEAEQSAGAGPSRLAPSMYHHDPYTHTHTMQFSHDNMFRQHQTELLRGAGLFADTREHCASE